jgi:hypothetical protein
MGRHGLQWLGSGGGRAFLDWLWLGSGFILLTGLTLRVCAGLFASQQVRFTGIAMLALGVLLAVLAWVGERVSGDTGEHR